MVPVQSGASRAMYHFGASVFDYCNGHSMQQVFMVSRLDATSRAGDVVLLEKRLVPFIRIYMLLLSGDQAYHRACR